MIRLTITLLAVSFLSGCAMLFPSVAMDVESADESIETLVKAAQAKVETRVDIEPVEDAAPPDIVGPRFDLEVDQVDAQVFFRGLTEDTPFNMVVHPDVRGSVTLALNAVTVLEVMEVMRDVYGFDFSVDNGLIQVFPDALRTEIFNLNYINVARSGQSEIQVSAGKVSDAGSTDAIVGDYQQAAADWSGRGGPGGQVVGTIVNTQGESDLWQEVSSTLESLVSLDDGSHVMVTPQVGLIVVKAKPASLRAVRAYIDQVESAVTRQVILEAKIIEVTLNEGFQAGIDWNSFGDASGGTFKPVSVTQADGSTVLVGGSERSVAGELISGAADIFNPLGTTFNLNASFGDFEATLNLLKTQGSVQVLSSPRIATVNNQKAVIKVGSDEFFVTDISSNTITAGSAINTNDSPELTPFFSGIALDVTPQISADEDVILHVHPTVSEVTEQLKEISGELVPLAASSIRESDSIVHARSGEVVVIGGLMQNSAKDNNAGVPWLHKIPLIGRFFAQRSQNRVKSELVILLRPVVVTPSTQREFLRASADQARAIRQAIQ